MTIAELRTAKYAEPFRPFRLLLQGGRAVLVQQPDTIAWSGDEGRLITVITEQGTATFDLGQVVALEPGGAARRRPARFRPEFVLWAVVVAASLLGAAFWVWFTWAFPPLPVPPR